MIGLFSLVTVGVGVAIPFFLYGGRAEADRPHSLTRATFFTEGFGAWWEQRRGFSFSRRDALSVGSIPTLVVCFCPWACLLDMQDII
jgi:hypothetical protein